MAERRPGRTCPISYRHGAAALAAQAAFQVETLWVAGGLYGNRFALERLLELYEAEPGAKALVFNGDFHWFDHDPEEFARVNRGVLAHLATRGNVETELAAPSTQAGCGCAYPEWVDDGTVERSNRILERLRIAALADPAQCEALARLPMHLVAEVAGERVAVVHGDAESLAGWEFSQERLATGPGAAAAAAALSAADARIFASSHTCLPVLQGFDDVGVIVNNGAAGMPNFAGTQYGLATRVSLAPHAKALYRTRIGPLHVEAIPIDYDAPAWRAAFLAQWPEGSDAHASYWRRIKFGPRYGMDLALRAA